MRVKALIIMGVSLFLLLGCELDFKTFKKEYLSSNKNINMKYGSVNGIEISEHDINLAKELLHISENFDNLEKNLREEIINLIVEKRLLAQHSMLILKDNTEFNQKVRQAKEELALNMWIQRETVKLKEKLKETDLETFYNKNKNLFLVPKQYKLRQIVLPDEKSMNKVFNLLKDKNSSVETFSQMAKEKSIDSTSEIGGDLGWIELEGLLPDVQKVITTMQKNQIVRLKNKTELGFHIFYLEDFKNSQFMKLESVEEDIKEILMKEKIDEMMDQTVKRLKKSAEIKIVTLK